METLKDAKPLETAEVTPHEETPHEISAETAAFIEKHLDEEDLAMIPMEYVAKTVDQYINNYADFPEEELVASVRADIFSMQVNKVDTARKEAEELGGAAGVKEFEERLLKVESMDILKAVGADEDAVAKVNAAFEGSAFEGSELLKKFTKLDTEAFDYSDYGTIEEGYALEALTLDTEERQKELSQYIEKTIAHIQQIFEGIRTDTILAKLQSVLEQIEASGSVNSINIPFVRKMLTSQGFKL